MSGFTPINKRVLIQPIEISNMSKGGILIPDNAKDKPDQGYIVAKARDCEFVVEGDLIMYGKFSGNPIKLENSDTGEKETLIILAEKEILGYFRGEKKDENDSIRN